eukprot:CAMPEP_0182470906 /NCGR_PEP_ID=MMETSP1319-20130603/19456_1 /TAXON_ID=172717 /ORGANISM="Bolidomonas pacifica, Strain RCC208" /LENGTH=389 /DNA_ID=CAMNT_0024671409 /DNA_START=51 /DNA_END=1217 /DNA_ORIENTATION=+
MALIPTFLFGPLLLISWGLLLGFHQTRLFAASFLALILLRVVFGLVAGSKAQTFGKERLEYTVDGGEEDDGSSASNALRPNTRSASKAPKMKPTIFFIHGWPDNSSVWDAQVSHFSKDYRCVRINLPHFSSSSRHPAMGYSFDSLVTLLASTLAHSLSGRPESPEGGGAGALLMVHDWGSWYGMQLQRRYPQLVRKMVVLDVAWVGYKPVPISKAAGMLVAMGVAYQYYAIFTWYVSITVPFVGPHLGGWMMLPFVSSFSQLPRTSYPDRETPINAMMNYPYFYLHLSMFLEGVGLVRGFDDRHGIAGKPPIYGSAETLPVLFIYGADKGFKFHSEKFEALLRERKNGEVKAVGVRGEGGKVKKPAGHWIQDSCSDEINEWSREFFEKS